MPLDGSRPLHQDRTCPMRALGCSGHLPSILSPLPINLADFLSRFILTNTIHLGVVREKSITLPERQSRITPPLISQDIP